MIPTFFAAFLARKVGLALVTLLLAVTVAFFLGRLAGDPVYQIVGDNAPPAVVQEARQQLGLDKPLAVQYAAYVGAIAHGDLGSSLRYSRPNLTLILGRLPASLELAALALLIGILLGGLLGAVAAVNENGWVDRLSVALALIGQSVPAYWLGIMLVIVFAINLQWLPAGQSGDWQHLVLPALTLSTLPMARVARLARSSLVEVLHEPFVASARSRGLSARRVFFAHVVRNAALPVITVVGLQAGALLSGAITVEFVFAWPGLGNLSVQAVQFRDFTLVQALVVFGSTSFVLINLLVDIVNSVIDPRVRAA